MEINQITQGDALSVLKGLPDGIVQTCVTSPPYYGLRDYGVEGQIGLEETPAGYVEKLVQVFREARRVLRDDGTLWLNLGDTYSDGTMGRKDAYQTINSRSMSKKMQSHPIKDRVTGGLGSKQLLGIPWHVAFALQADGWILRSDIIWSKSNCMPESVEDRPTKSHEYLFLLAKSERYYYDHTAILEPFNPNANISYEHKGAAKYGPMGGTHGGPSSTLGTVGRLTDRAGRNKRSVWVVPTLGYSHAHFATFPPKLIEPCILAGTSPRACEHCGSPWERMITETGHINQRKPAHVPNNNPTKNSSTKWAPTKLAMANFQPTCSCANEGTSKCIILDPFMGAGTVALVAIQHGRNYIGIDLNTSYVQLAEERIATVQQNLWTSGSEAIAV